MDQIQFAKSILFTSQVGFVTGDDRITVIETPPMKSVADHDTFFASELWKYIETTHALVVQWDGYVLNGSAWDDKFLDFDLIGAPWFWNNVVGNMGFCLISQKMLVSMSIKENMPVANPLDIGVCQTYRAKLEGLGMKYAPLEVANRFSVENNPYEGQFGWHGMNPFYGDAQ